ncbi:hypothetical protein H8356DRAFT_932164 [Neocallimastix lanati (nom. inval.)]|uniref:RRM domain-containing protein n=1 Tax=Neocallimastix californiae TaxID=1754190 RepID=A0A1Y2AYH9_9FUNG|nr:hypothetical protein H8356DRAFT_932164 [Neocallimastix sp. JGI-2020a]ORY27514.1 hypothetical protein LY90DRAFT_513387 [Neocallimastix californiae]|eukprot:ORY27514.1 hypothetical protein LY90DRAFT_513387 [Neocallimastix californiae]
MENYNETTSHNNIMIDTTTNSDVCNTRKEYRKGNNPTSVKVYTIVQESRYLIVSNVPTLGITKELIELFALYGPIEEYRFLDEHDNTTSYFDTYWIKFKNIGQASPLKVEYSPESENEDDIRMKINDRINSVLKRLEALKKQNIPLKNEDDQSNKNKKGKPSLMNFYNQPVTLKSNLKNNDNNNIPEKKFLKSKYNIMDYHEKRKRVHLLSNTNNNPMNINNNNNNNNNSVSTTKRQRRRI